ncbi:MAG: methyltransferase domain-containing protein [Candidatus Omnitrophica bacterium]|nr:methyltransferase domain-containing protein [Candidatus Omnitrophota bacterium]
MSVEIKKRHEERFDRWSKVYDRSVLQMLIFNTSHNMFFKEMAPYIKDGMKVLDIGCGTGKFAYRLCNINKDARIHGIDISGDMIKKAEAKRRDENIEFKVGDVENLPYDSHTFDVITCSNSFHHYPNQKRAVAEMHRVLKEDGKLMIVDGCRDRLLGKVIFGIVEIVEGDVYHIFENELRNMLMSVGFDKVKQRKFNPMAPLLFTMGHATKEKKL